MKGERVESRQDALKKLNNFTQEERNKSRQRNQSNLANKSKARSLVSDVPNNATIDHLNESNENFDFEPRINPSN